ncbi:MAG: undecaprenyldiphospho-muramoylpentapeptide beta-N-acetylglucosaminyltransferase, partial [Myxococcales bacterium]|nr:undecaprenyldiphospho-muramoylpentapeptide beta-N-acetylglucosaminyltransferase [Myxococcales bacterium]
RQLRRHGARHQRPRDGHAGERVAAREGEPMRVLIAGGGTGGHLFPGVAVAEEFLARDPATAILFVGTARRMETRLIPALGFRLETIEIEGLAGKSLSQILKTLLALPRAFLQSIRIVKRFDPSVAVGVGGYAAGPVLCAARARGVRAAILEQNAVPGITNKLLGRVAQRVYLTYASTARFFAARKVRVPGNAIRKDLAARAGAPVTRAEGRALLVFGGSLGARAINEGMIAAAPHLARADRPLEIVHQTGPDDVERVEAAYRDAGLAAKVLPFIDDMASAYAAADLVIARAGAGTLAELAVAARPSILIPLARSAGNHQVMNARETERRGAARVIEEREIDPKALADTIVSLLADPDARARMAAAAAAEARPHAARDIVDDLLQLVEGA